MVLKKETIMFKQRGFTVAELLITLGIIGVVAAISAPMILNLFPDNDKAQVIRINKLISEINNELLSDPSLYLITGNCTGLDCTDRPLNPNFQENNFQNNFFGFRKYGNLFASKLVIDGEITNIATNTSFTTTDGINWLIQRNIINPQNPINPNWLYTIRVDLNGNGGNNCTYDSNTCPNPDRFSFNILSSGDVLGGDSLTRAYLKNPDNMNNKKKDYEEANALSNNENADN